MLQAHASTTIPDAFFRTLTSTQRSPDIPASEDIYGFFVGSWELEIASHDDEGVTRETIGEAHAARVLDGRAIQDVFINPRRTDRGPSMAQFANWFGTTIRIYDATTRAWRVWWFNPHDGVRAQLIGRRVNDSVVQDGAFPDGTRIRWTFSEIRPDSFRWRGERAEPDGRWHLQVDLRGRRIK